MIKLTPPQPFLFCRGTDKALLVGCGPSLDAFTDWDSYRAIIALNETIVLAPFRAVGLAWDGDPVRRILSYCYKKGQCLPQMLVEKDVWDSKRGKGCSWVRGEGSWFSRANCLKECCRIGSATVAVGIFDSYDIKTVHLVGFDSYWDWFKRSEGGTKGVARGKGTEGTYGVSEAVREILRLTEGKPVNRGGAMGQYDRINKALHSAARSRGVRLEKA